MVMNNHVDCDPFIMWHGGVGCKVMDSTDMDMLVDLFNIQVAGIVDNHVNFEPFIVWHG